MLQLLTALFTYAILKSLRQPLTNKTMLRQNRTSSQTLYLQPWKCQ